MKKKIDRESFYLWEYSTIQGNSFVLEKQFEINEGTLQEKISLVRTNQKYLARCFK